MTFQKVVPGIFAAAALVGGWTLANSNTKIANPIQNLTVTADVDFESLSGKVVFYDNSAKEMLLKDGKPTTLGGWIVSPDGRFIGHRGGVFAVYGNSPEQRDANVPMPKLALR